MLILKQGGRFPDPPPPLRFFTGAEFLVCPGLNSPPYRGIDGSVFRLGREGEQFIADCVALEAATDDLIAIWNAARLFTRPTGPPRHAISGTLDPVETRQAHEVPGDTPYVRKRNRLLFHHMPGYHYRLFGSISPWVIESTAWLDKAAERAKPQHWPFCFVSSNRKAAERSAPRKEQPG